MGQLLYDTSEGTVTRLRFGEWLELEKSGLASHNLYIAAPPDLFEASVTQQARAAHYVLQVDLKNGAEDLCGEALDYVNAYAHTPMQPLAGADGQRI